MIPGGFDFEDVEVPEVVHAVAAGERVSGVWRNEVGGLTFEVGAGAERRFVKWSPFATGPDLTREVARLRWARAYTPVPEVLDHGMDEHGWWTVTAALDGENAVAPRWRADPVRAVAALGEGLRALHEALPVEACPFSWSVEDRLARAVKPPPAEEPPPVDLLVVCQGDACAPNTLLGDDGRWSGHVDLGDLGVADRWADLAVASWSTEWNYGPGWERLLLASYGVDADADRTRYYRLLWDSDP